MTVLPRAATNAEKAKLRSGNQTSQLFLYIYNPARIFTAQIAATPSSLDEVTSLAIENITGDPAHVLDNMTVWIGSAAGQYDVGIARARRAESDTLYLGATSDVQFEAGQYLSVLPDFQIWSKKLSYVDPPGEWYIEAQDAYSGQHATPDPIPVFGPIAAVLQLTGSTVSLQMDASNSWCPGETIEDWIWSTTGPADAVNIDGNHTATVTITFDTPGAYRVNCSAGASNGKYTLGYRYVIVYDDTTPPITQFKLDNLSVSDGGYDFTVTLYDEADLADVRDQALVVLFTRDWYGATDTDEGSLGFVPGYENILGVGWINEDEVDWDPEQGLVQLSVRGPAWWMNVVDAWPFALMDTTSAPTAWTEMQALTVDKAIWQFVYWRSTICRILDVYPPNDTRRVFDCKANTGSLWSQLKNFTSSKIGAIPMVDRLGRLFVEIDPQLLDTSERDALPVVHAITTDDWIRPMNIPRRAPTTSYLRAEGFAFISGEWVPIICEAPGGAKLRVGKPNTLYDLAFSDQAQANELTGRLLARDNNPYPSIPIRLASNHRLIDIAPRMWFTISIAAEDTPRGIVWINKRLIPRRLSFEHNPQTGLLLTSGEFEAEAFGVPGVTVIPPVINTTNPGGPPPDPGGTVGTPRPTDPPGADDDDPCAASPFAPPTGPWALNFNKTEILPGESAFAPFPCTIRYSGAVPNLSKVVFGYGSFWGDASQHYAISAGAINGSNSVYPYESVFTPVSPVSVSGITVSLEAGGEYEYVPGDAIRSGSVLATSADGVEITGLVVGEWYALESAGGPYKLSDPDQSSYSFMADVGFGWSPEGVDGGMGSWYTLEGNLVSNYKMPVGAAHVEAAGLYARVYWQASTTTAKFKAYDQNDGARWNNSGSLGYVLREASVTPVRRITLRGWNIRNVCF